MALPGQQIPCSKCQFVNKHSHTEHSIFFPFFVLTFPLIIILVLLICKYELDIVYSLQGVRLESFKYRNLLLLLLLLLSLLFAVFTVLLSLGLLDFASA